MIDMFDFGKGLVPAHLHPNGGGWVADTAYVAPTAYVGPDARVFERARVCDRVKVYDSAQLHGSAWALESVQVCGGARVSGNAVVSGSALLCGDAWLLGTARVRGDALVRGGKWPRSPLYIEGSRHSVTMCAPGNLAIGCQVYSIKHWIAWGKKIGREYRYSDAEIEEYERYIRLAAEMCPEEEEGDNE